MQSNFYSSYRKAISNRFLFICIRQNGFIVPVQKQARQQAPYGCSQIQRLLKEKSTRVAICKSLLHPELHNALLPLKRIQYTHLTRYIQDLMDSLIENNSLLTGSSPS